MIAPSVDKKKFFPAVIIAVLAAAAVFGSLGRLFTVYDLRMTDAMYLGYTPPSDTVIVAIDNATIQSVVGGWPFDRSVHAQLITALKKAGAKVIAYDVNFPEAKSTAGDAALATALADAGNVILPYEAERLTVVGDMVYAEQSLVPIPAFTDHAILGLTNMFRDRDGIIRRAPWQATTKKGETISSFFARVIAGAGFSAGSGMHRIDFAGPPGTIITVSAKDVLDGTASSTLFRDAAVFVGATASDLHDDALTPTATTVRMSGVEVHANAYLSARRGGLQEVPTWATALIAFFGALFLAFCSLTLRRTRWSLLLTFGVCAFYLLTALLLFDVAHMVANVFHILLAWFGAAVAGGMIRLRRERTEKGQLKAALQQYVSKQVVTYLMEHPEKLALGGEKKNMSVLFTDLRGFTSLSEKLTPEQLVTVLNTYLTDMTRLVFTHGGVLDKYMGDAVMSFWNAPLDNPDHALAAVQTALAMRDRLHEMNATGAFPEGIKLALGGGVNTGDMVVGNMGGHERFDYTVMGDAVNLGSRLEGLNKEYATELICSEFTAKKLPDTIFLRVLDLVAVKGKKEPVLIYEIVDEVSKVSGERKAFLASFTSAHALYSDRKFVEAHAAFATLAQIDPNDGPTKVYLERSAYFLAHPPVDGWDGVWVMTKK